MSRKFYAAGRDSAKGAISCPTSESVLASPKTVACEELVPKKNASWQLQAHA